MIIPPASSLSARKSTEIAADLLKQAAEVEAAEQCLKDLLSEIAKKTGATGSTQSSNDENGPKVRPP